MPLTPGSRLGSYEIVSLLGSGGMGVVYRARDTKLGREVAVKVLPEIFAENPERLGRFEREARILASLNHTNIATLYGLEESNGVHFLVMELVQGETLAERIGQRPLLIDEALPFFVQLAEGLEAAHEKGIIHRDLKPSNIKITLEEKVKILDFGLAKALAGEVPATGISESPTVTRDATETGVLLGTAPYMSPEQARGRMVDKRADIWAYGCCLYEALTGKRAFLGATVTDTLAKIIEREPNWNALPEKTPAIIRSLLHRCLHKDPEKRIHDIADARIEIEEALVEPFGAGLEASQTGRSRARWLQAFPWGVALAAMAVLIWVLLQYPSQGPQTVKRWTIELPSQQRLVGDGRHLDISPDGTHLVYVGTSTGGWQLYLRHMGQLDATPIPGTEGAIHPFFSPDGEWVGFFAGTKLRKVSVSGGVPVALCEIDSRHRGATWGPDGTIIFATSASGLQQVSADGGSPVVLVKPDTDRERVVWPHFLPGGRAVLYTLYKERPSVAVLYLETGERRILIEQGTNPRYATTGHIVFARAESLFAVSFDLSRLEVRGQPAPLPEPVQWTRIGAGDAAQFTSSSDGILAYEPTPVVSERSLVWVDRRGVAQPLTAKRRDFNGPRLSPDGRQVAVFVGNTAEATSDIWIIDLEHDTLSRLTSDGHAIYPIWTPDGKRVSFTTGEPAITKLCWTAFDGSSAPEDLLVEEYSTYQGRFSPDGRMLVFRELHSSAGRDIAVVSVGSDAEPTTLVGTRFDEHSPMLSPDANWLAYVSNESGRDEVYVTDFPGPGGRRTQVSDEGGTEPMWRPDGRELFYRHGGEMIAVTVNLEPSFEITKRERLFEGRFVENLWHTNYDIDSKGERFLMVQRGEKEEAQIHIVLNWFEELKRRAPWN